MEASDHSAVEVDEISDAVEEARDDLLVEEAGEASLVEGAERDGRPSFSSPGSSVSGQRATQHEWDDLVPLGDELFQAARHSHYAHNAEAIGIAHKGQELSIAAAVLALVSGASLLVRLSDLPALANDKAWVQVVQGLVALAAACLSAIQTRLNLSKSADMHRRAAVEYGAIRRRMKIMFRLPLHERDGIREFFERLQRDLHDLADLSPEISSNVWTATRDRLLEDPSPLMGTRSDDDLPSPA